MSPATAEREQSRTTGVVVGHAHRARRSFDRTEVLVHPVVEFTPEGGSPVRFESPLGSNVPPPVGERVTVLYRAENPEETAEVPLGDVLRFGKWHLLAVATIFLVPTMLLALLAATVIVVSLL